MTSALLVVLLLGFGVLLGWALLRLYETRTLYTPPTPYEAHAIRRARATMQEIDDLANAAIDDMVALVTDRLRRRHFPH